jgi:hypothetical protein
MENPLKLSLEEKMGDPLESLDQLRNALIAFTQLKACEGCLPAYGRLLACVEPLEEERVQKMQRLQQVYKGINACTGRLMELLEEERKQLCRPCLDRLEHLIDVVNFVQECDQQPYFSPFTDLRTSGQGDEVGEQER